MPWRYANMLRLAQAHAAAPKPPRAKPSPPSGVKRTVRDTLKDKLLAHRERLTGKRTLPTIPGTQSLAIAIRYLDGGRDRWLELVQNAVLHDQEPAEKWWYVYSTLTVHERVNVSFDDICAASGVSPSAIVCACLNIEMTFGREVGDLVRAAAFPKVVHTLVKSALKEDSEIGERDRARFLQASNFLPTPKGTIIQVAANAQAAASASLDPSVPSFAADMESLTGTSRPAPAALPEPDESPE